MEATIQNTYIIWKNKTSVWHNKDYKKIYFVDTHNPLLKKCSDIASFFQNPFKNLAPPHHNRTQMERDSKEEKCVGNQYTVSQLDNWPICQRVPMNAWTTKDSLKDKVWTTKNLKHLWYSKDIQRILKRATNLKETLSNPSKDYKFKRNIIKSVWWINTKPKKSCVLIKWGRLHESFFHSTMSMTICSLKLNKFIFFYCVTPECLFKMLHSSKDSRIVREKSSISITED